VINGSIYDENNPTGQEIIPGGSVNGCDSTINIALVFSDVVTAFIEEELCEGEVLFVNGNPYDQSNPSGTETIPNGSLLGCDRPPRRTRACLERSSEGPRSPHRVRALPHPTL